VALKRWPADGPTVLLIHGLGSLADSWWRIGPGLAALGFDVTAVDQAGHGGRALRGEATPDVLAEAVREIHPEPPDVLIGHSLGTVTALALQPGWGRTVILEEPASSLQPDVCVTISESLTADAVAVRRDRPAVVERVRRENPPWSDEDVHWSVEGMAQMDAAPFARRVRRCIASTSICTASQLPRTMRRGRRKFASIGFSRRTEWRCSPVRI